MKKNETILQDECVINLPLERVKEFFHWEKTVEKAPVSYSIKNLVYNGVIGENEILITMTLEIETYSEDWISIPLLQSDAILVSTELNDGSFPQIKGAYSFLINKKGVFSISLKFYLPFQSKERKNSFRLLSFGSAKSVFKIGKTGLTWNIPNGAGVESTETKTETTINCFLPNGESIISWLPKVEQKTVKKVDPIVYGEVFTSVFIGEMMIRCMSEVQYSIYQAGVTTFKISVLDAKVMSVTGDRIRNYDLIQNEKGTSVIVYSEYEVDKNFTLSLHYEKNIDQKDSESNLPQIFLEGIDRASGYISVSGKTNIELRVKEQSKLTMMDVKELPKSMKNESVNAQFAFRHINPDYSLLLEIKRHEEIPVLVSIADNGIYTSVVLEDGKIMHMALLQVRNNSKPFLSIQLPEGGVCLSSFVDGRAVKPIKNENGTLMLPIPKSGESEWFMVEYVWMLSNVKLDKKGELSLDLGLIEIAINKFYWSLYLPEEYKFSNFRGNVKNVDYLRAPSLNTYSKASQNMPIQKTLPKPVSAPMMQAKSMVASFSQQESQKLDIDNDYDECCEESFDDGYINNNIPIPPQESISKRKIAPSGGGIFQNDILGKTLPVKVDIPRTGVVNYFERFFLNEERPVLKVEYKKIVKWFKKRKEVKPL
ncbi:hypothetical protein JXR93_10755 [bacterium]|nr:hypothetical protein [bacterium]